MATGTSIFLLALGAILAFATDLSVSGLDLQTVGVILMVAGAIGIFVSLLWIDRARGGRVGRGRVGRGRVVRRVVEEPVVERRIVEEPVVERRIVEERRDEF